MERRRLGIVGFGSLGRYLAKLVLADPRFELVFVWNRSGRDSVLATPESKLFPEETILEDLDSFASRNANIIIEVAHPSITLKYGLKFLQHANYVIGSPTALADADLWSSLKAEAERPTGFGLYVPSGAFWGSQDIQKMATNKTLTALSVTMKKHPQSMKLHESLASKQQESIGFAGETILFEGSVRDICSLAPNNVNTMAVAAIAAENLGFDGVKAVLVGDNRLQDHVIEIVAEGAGLPGRRLVIKTTRVNPADPGAVTGSATFASFWSSLSLAYGRGDGIHLC